MTARIQTNTEANRQLITAVMDALSRGERAPFGAAMHEEAVWIMKGATAWSGTYRGRAEIAARLLTPLFAQFTGQYRNRPVRILADGDFVVVECEGEVMTRSGAPYNNQYCYIFRLEGGLIRELTEYMDTALVDRVLGPPA